MAAGRDDLQLAGADREANDELDALNGRFRPSGRGVRGPEMSTLRSLSSAAALDPIGGLLGVRQFPATAAGDGRLLDWLSGFGTVRLVGIEGTGSYGARLAGHVTGDRH